MGENILYFSSDEWGSSLRTSQYHIAIQLSKRSKVLYINSIGLRTPRASKGDIRKVRKKLGRWLRGVEKIDQNLFVVTPIVLPFHRYRIVHRLNRLLLIYFIKYYQFRLKLQRPILITFLPNVLPVLGALNEKQIIYYCADQMSSFHGVSGKVVKEMEQKLIEQADLVITTSRKLYQEKKVFNQQTYYLPHGVDFDLFSRTQTEDLIIPEKMKQIDTPIIGFFGLISADWIDYDLLTYLAVAHPEWSFVMIGKIDGLIPEYIRECKNIIFLGPKKYEDLPAYLRAFDAAIIPFVKSELTLYCNPIKAKEYLASGKPVVSVDIAQLRDYEDVIEIAISYEDFALKLERVLSEDSTAKVQIRMNTVKEETWDFRAGKIIKLFNNLAVRGAVDIEDRVLEE